jgi:hypothetical protein
VSRPRTSSARPRVVQEQAPPVEVCAFCSEGRACLYHSATAMAQAGGMLHEFLRTLPRAGTAELARFIGACHATTESVLPDAVLDLLSEGDLAPLEKAFQRTYDRDAFDPQALRELAAHAHALAIALDAQADDNEAD